MTTLRNHNEGTITLPASLRKKYKREEGAILTIMDLSEGIILIRPMVSQVNELANLIAKKFREEILRSLIYCRH
jgi:bifunctional DNA-binding transcriptional regulator/antitoxin component of YhaV-PrlF toxin-antitoxin module